MQVRAGIYLRISYVRKTDGTIDTLGIERQEPPCRQLVERIGGTVVDTYPDNDISAWSGKKREQYERMLKDLKSGRINTIVAWKHDRFVRSTAEAPRLRKIVTESGGNLMTSDGAIDLASATGAYMFNALVNNAELESALKSERLIAKYMQVAESGEPKSGGTRAFGFKRDGKTHDPVEAELLKEAAERLISGESMYALLNDWKARGITAPRGGPMSTTSLRRALLAPRTIGMRQHRGVVIGPATWKGIIEPDEQQRLRALFTGRERQGEGRAPQAMLTQVARCSLCGNHITATAKRGRPYYSCHRTQRRETACQKIIITREPLNAFIEGLLFTRLTGPGLQEIIRALTAHDPDTASINDEIERLGRDLARLEDDRYVNTDSRGRPMVSEDRYPVLRDRIMTRIDALRVQLKPRPETRVLMDLQTLEGSLRDAWHSFTMERKREIIRAALPDIRIHPADPTKPRRFDDKRVEYRWIDHREPTRGT